VFKVLKEVTRSSCAYTNVQPAADSPFEISCGTLALEVKPGLWQSSIVTFLLITCNSETSVIQFQALRSQTPLISYDRGPLQPEL
jgi:hypothetical protein